MLVLNAHRKGNSMQSYFIQPKCACVTTVIDLQWLNALKLYGDMHDMCKQNAHKRTTNMLHGKITSDKIVLYSWEI